MSGVLIGGGSGFGSPFGGSGSPLPVDLLVRFNNGTVDGLISAANIQSGTLGLTPGTWSKSRPAAINHTYRRVSSKTLPFSYLCNGTTVSSVTDALEFALGAVDWEGFTWTAGSSNAIVTLQFLATFASTDGSADTAVDLFVLSDADGEFCVSQNHRANPSQNGTQGDIKAHTDLGADGFVTALVPNTACLVTVLYDSTNDQCQIILQDGTTRALIGTSYIAASATLGNLFSILLQDYLQSFGGTIRVHCVALDWTNHAFPLGPLTVPAPTSVTATQTDAGEVTLTFTTKAIFNLIERSSNGGSSYSTLSSAFHGNSYVDATVVDATTYIYRVTGTVGSAGSPSATSNSLLINDNAFVSTFGDDFNRANGGLGSNWTTVTGFSAPSVVSNACKGTSSSVHHVANYTASGVVNANQWAQFKITGATTGTTLGPVLRSDGAGTFYTCYFNSGSGPISIYKWIAGAATSLGSSGTVNMFTNDVLYLQVSGNTLTVKVNGIVITSVTDSAITAAGYTGIDLYSNVGIIDDFAGGAL